MKESFSNKIKIFHDALEKRNAEVENLRQITTSIHQKAVNQYQVDKNNHVSITCPYHIKNLVPNLDETINSSESPNNKNLMSDNQVEDIEGTVRLLESKLLEKNKENEQLRADIQTLLDFKNELEGLVEDQNKQIQSLSGVRFGYRCWFTNLGF